MSEWRMQATQFAKQNILRTITVGYQPYLPFSQQYELQYKFKGEPGYFELGPQASSSVDKTGTHGDNYPFETRMKTYMGEGEEGLAYMSKYHGTSPNDRASQMANNHVPANTRGRTNRMAERLANMFTSNMDLAPVKMSSRDFGEQALGDLSKALDKELKISQTQKKIDRGTTKTGKFFGGGFDIELEKASTSLREFLSKSLKDIDIDTVHSLEMTRAQGDSSGSKLLSMSKEDVDSRKEKTIKQKFKGHIKDKFQNFNTIIKDAAKAMADSGIGQKEYDKYMDKTGSSIGAARSFFPTATYSPKEDRLLNKTARELLSRIMRTEFIKQLDKTGKGPTSYLYQVKLPHNMLGFTLVSGKVNTYTGKAGTISYPKIVTNNPVWTMPAGAGGGLQSAYSDWMKAENSDKIDIINGLTTESIAASSGKLIATTDRMGRIYDEASVSAAYMASNNVGLNVGNTVLSNVRLTPFDIAENLRQQMLNHFTNDKNVTKEYRRWYRDLTHDSNKLTRKWFDNAPEGVRGGKFSEEWIYGDNKGNPNKRFLGIWSARSQNTWKGDVGRNISISPFVSSRRKGVAAFRKGGDFDQ